MICILRSKIANIKTFIINDGKLSVGACAEQLLKIVSSDDK